MTASELIAEYVTEPLALPDTSLPGPTPAVPGTGAVLDGHYLNAVEGGYDWRGPRRHHEAVLQLGVHRLRCRLHHHRPRSLRPGGGEAGPAHEGEAGALRRPALGGRRRRILVPGRRRWLPGGASMMAQHGWTPGYATAAYSDPATGFTVAVVLNDSTAGAQFAQQPLVGARSHRLEGAGRRRPDGSRVRSSVHRRAVPPDDHRRRRSPASLLPPRSEPGLTHRYSKGRRWRSSTMRSTWMASAPRTR